MMMLMLAIHNLATPPGKPFRKSQTAQWRPEIENIPVP
jgi:hypothetical protein